MSGDDRRTAIAVAAVELVSEEGVRALTHRSIDRRMGLPEGSTSYYMRTRRALLKGMVEELSRQGGRDFQVMAEMTERREGLGPDTVGLFAASVVVATLTQRRAQAAARIALATELTADPELHAQITSRAPSREPLLNVVGGMLSRLGVRDARRRAADLVAMMDGMIFDRIAGARMNEPFRAGEVHLQLTDTFGSWVRGLLASDAAHRQSTGHAPITTGPTPVARTPHIPAARAVR
ncbi:TetR family transcriptional regulator [Nakamurella sp. YIM 132087]|uniref:TetR family transcriptional regulator n=1 Tax=Nakamurella alba TaxID=2665158 RepID=A0A7K1FNQ3_9ACTN|nr:TetR family transcriptional regulator [Nakamurella alba]MTD15710.1 TetR family transcriptional regulator [Nakamurella alba]